MGKRSEFERKERDFYPTPISAVEPLISHITRGSSFYEPCAGDNRLVSHLESFGLICTGSSDIEPQHENVKEIDALEVSNVTADYIITNPPWDRKLLHPMIDYFSDITPTWLLFDSDWMHTKQSIQYLPKLKRRVKWIEGSKSVGKDNCCWYLFSKTPTVAPVEFCGRK